jgi:hypothetical protein
VKAQQETQTAKLHQKTAQAQRSTKNLTTRAQQNISPTAAKQTKNCERPTVNSDSVITPTKTVQAQHQAKKLTTRAQQNIFRAKQTTY